MFISKKKVKRLELTTYALGGTGVVVGTAGAITAIATSIGASKKVKHMEEDVESVKRHIAKCEEQITSHGRCISAMQTTLQMNGLLGRPQ